MTNGIQFRMVVTCTCFSQTCIITAIRRKPLTPPILDLYMCIVSRPDGNNKDGNNNSHGNGTGIGNGGSEGDIHSIRSS